MRCVKADSDVARVSPVETVAVGTSAGWARTIGGTRAARRGTMMDLMGKRAQAWVIAIAAIAAIAAIGATGCGSVESQIDAPPNASDAPPGAVDARPDSSIPGGTVACAIGGMECPLPSEFCCVDPAGAASCRASPPDPSCTAYQCDGPEDCAGGDCCLTGGSQCVAAGACDTTGASRMCHAQTDCFAGENCCSASPGPVMNEYGVCRAGPCPQ